MIKQSFPITSVSWGGANEEKTMKTCRMLQPLCQEFYQHVANKNGPSRTYSEQIFVI